MYSSFFLRHGGYNKVNTNSTQAGVHSHTQTEKEVVKGETGLTFYQDKGHPSEELMNYCRLSPEDLSLSNRLGLG